MAKARNRNLGGLAALGALGLAMARLGKREPGDSGPTPEDRGDMVVTRAAATPVAAAAEERDYSDEIAKHAGSIGLTTPDSAAAAPSIRQRPVVSTPGGKVQSAPARASAPAAAASQAAPARPAASAASAAQPARAASAAQPASSPQAAPAASAAKPASRGLTLGTPTRPAEGAPSIYAGPEAWAAYRQRQAAGMKKGGTVKMASGGSVSSASKRGDGIALRGKTRGKLV